jgi:hypothetical protein
MHRSTLPTSFYGLDHLDALPMEIKERCPTLNYMSEGNPTLIPETRSKTSAMPSHPEGDASGG